MFGFICCHLYHPSEKSDPKDVRKYIRFQELHLVLECTPDVLRLVGIVLKLSLFVCLFVCFTVSRML